MEKSVFLEVLGDSHEMRIIDFLIEHRWSDYTKTEIAKWCEVSRPTLYKIWPHLEKNGIIKPTRKFSRATLYKLNEDNELVKALVEVDRVILKKIFNEVGQEKIKLKA